MKRVLGGLVAVVMLLSLVTGACASTFGRTFSELKQIVKDNAGSLRALEYTTNSGSDTMVVVYETSTGTYTLGVFSYSGKENKILVYKMYINGAYKGSRSNALDFINKWNYDNRYPRAFIDDSENMLMADGFLMMTSDCSTDMVDEFVSDMIFGTKQLVSEMESENIMP